MKMGPPKDGEDCIDGDRDERDACDSSDDSDHVRPPFRERANSRETEAEA